MNLKLITGSMQILTLLWRELVLIKLLLHCKLCRGSRSIWNRHPPLLHLLTSRSKWLLCVHSTETTLQCCSTTMNNGVLQPSHVIQPPQTGTRRPPPPPPFSSSVPVISCTCSCLYMNACWDHIQTLKQLHWFQSIRTSSVIISSTDRQVNRKFVQKGRK